MNRKILASMLIVGVVAAVAGGSTFALFNDTETSDTNTFEAGALDLQIDWVESYNGEVIEEQELTDNPGPIFELGDVKPGDVGEANVSVHVEDNPSYLYMDIEQTASAENGCTEPEAEVDSSCEGDGELPENMEVTVTDTNGDVIYDGTMDGLNEENVYLGETDPDTIEYVGIDWNVPREVGNEIQTDSLEFDLSFYAEQARHNSPEGTEAESEADEDDESDAEDESEEDAEDETDEDDEEMDDDTEENQTDTGDETDPAGDVTCDDFDSQREAQDYFEENDAGHLDADNDNIACEALA